MCVTDLLCSTAETNNIVNQLYSNKIIFLEKPIPQKKKGGGGLPNVNCCIENGQATRPDYMTQGIIFNIL